MDHLIDIRNVVKSFPIGNQGELTVLNGVDFTMGAAEFVSLIGASGSGKSTLMNIIGLLDRPSSGEYYLGGENVLQLSDDALAHYRSEQIGFVFQNFNLVARMDARRNVEMPMMYAGLSKSARKERAMHLLEQVGMADRADHQPSELSGGQKQRVAIARALANDPALLLADEPTGALDSHTGRLVMDLFHELNTQGRGILFITHNPELAAETGRIVEIADGVIAGGTQ